MLRGSYFLLSLERFPRALCVNPGHSSVPSNCPLNPRLPGVEHAEQMLPQQFPTGERMDKVFRGHKQRSENLHGAALTLPPPTTHLPPLSPVSGAEAVKARGIRMGQIGGGHQMEMHADVCRLHRLCTGNPAWTTGEEKLSVCLAARTQLLLDGILVIITNSPLRDTPPMILGTPPLQN